MKRPLLKACTAWVAAASFLQPVLLSPALAAGQATVASPAASATLTTAQKIAMLQSKVKYVFVIFAENESFDHYFGTFPGANGLYAAPAGTTPASSTPSFTQRYLDTSLNVVEASPFLMPQAVKRADGTVVQIYPADEISVDHSHQGMANDLDVDTATGVSANDRYAMDQESLTTLTAGGALVKSSGAAPTSIALSAKQKAETDLAHIDCDTIPFMWSWASKFVLFDNFHQSIVGPSTPNAIAIISGQSGQTQWALHANEGATVTYANPLEPNVLGASFKNTQTTQNVSNAYVPVIADPGPFPGSNLDTNAVKPPYNFDENPANPSLNLTFATQPLSFMGSDIGTIIRSDPNPRADLLDVAHDIQAIAVDNPAVNWGWFQQGFNNNDAPDPYETQGTGTGGTGTVTSSSYTGYVLHHNAPQYFGYLADNPVVLNANLHGAQDFSDAVEHATLPAGGGVFYLRGGYSNNAGLVPVDPTPAIKQAFIGNDDHPAYSDQQISEAFVAKAVADIAASPYWSESAVIITYDETDGFYDHVSPTMHSTMADGSILAAGPRIPAIVVSPYAATGTISHQYSEHSSVLKLINELFGLVPLASLPDEKRGFAMGQSVLGQPNLGPADGPTGPGADVGDMLEAFDYDILAGTKAPLPASMATFTPAQIAKLPHLAGTASPNGYTNGACAAIGVLPTDFPTAAAYAAGQPSDPYPLDVNPRPTQSVGSPYYNTNSATSLAASTGPWVP